MKQINIDGLKSIFDNVLGAAAMTITFTSEPKMEMEKNPYIGVIKTQRIHFNFNRSYEKMMKKINPAFILKEAKWGTTSDNKTRQLGEKKYLKVIPDTTEVLSYTLNGVDIPEHYIKPFLKDTTSNFKTVNITSIIHIRCLGEDYEVI